MKHSNILKSLFILLAISSSSVILHYQHFDKDIISFHSWRQALTYSTTLSFYEEDLNIFNPRRNDRGNDNGIYRQEFPLYQWINAIVFKVSKPSVKSVRIVTFIISLFTCFAFFLICQILWSKYIVSFISAWALTFSPSFFYYSITPLPDNLALLFLMCGFYFYLKFSITTKTKFLVITNILFCLAALGKLPYILSFAIPISHLLLTKRKTISLEIYYSISLIIFPIIWYAIAIPNWDSKFLLGGFLTANEHEFSYFYLLQYNLFSVFPELLLNYASLPFFIIGVFTFGKRKIRSLASEVYNSLRIYGFLCILFFLYELYTINKIHDYYLFIFYPLIFMIVGNGINHLVELKKKSINSLLVFLTISIPVFCLLRMDSRWDTNKPGFNQDWMSMNLELREIGTKSDLAIVGNDVSHCIAMYYVNKKGWNFKNDELSEITLQNIINQGGKYLFTDSEKISTNKELSKFYEELIFDRNSIKVFRLKSSENSIK